MLNKCKCAENFDIRVEGASRLSEALKVNTTLTQLNLNSNQNTTTFAEKFLMNEN